VSALGVGKFVWKESTRDRHYAVVGHGSIDVHRSRSWKRYGHEKPWRLELFGNPHVSRLEFADLDEAKRMAETMAIEMLGKAAEDIGMVWPHSNDAALLERLRVAESARAQAIIEKATRITTTGLSCSFCGKDHREVAKTIAGPNVNICDECVGLCNDILAETLEVTLDGGQTATCGASS